MKTKTNAEIINERMMTWPINKSHNGGSAMQMVLNRDIPLVRYDTMSKLQSLNFILPIEDITMYVIGMRPNILPSAVGQLVTEIKQSALLHACAFLSCGGVKKWKHTSPPNLIGELASSVRTMAVGISNMSDMLSTSLPSEDNRPWQLESQHRMTTNWAISLDDWAVVTAAFAYQIVNTILACSDGLVEHVERYNEHVLFFTPQRIWEPKEPGVFAFSIGIFNRELLPAPGQESRPLSMGY